MEQEGASGWESSQDFVKWKLEKEFQLRELQLKAEAEARQLEAEARQLEIRERAETEKRQMEMEMREKEMAMREKEMEYQL